MTANAEKTKTAKPAVGYVGLGIMGAPCARNLLAAGFAVHVFARRSEAADPLVAAGATRHPDLSSLARACEIVVTNVTDTDDVLQIVLGADGVGRSLPPGAIVIDMSTIAPGRRAQKSRPRWRRTKSRFWIRRFRAGKKARSMPL